METQKETRRYFVTKSNKIVEEYEIRNASEIIFGNSLKEKEFDQFVKNCIGIKGEISPDMPTDIKIRLFLECGEKVKAVKEYYNAHPKTTLKEAYKEITEIEKQIKKYGGAV